MPHCMCVVSSKVELPRFSLLLHKHQPTRVLKEDGELFAIWFVVVKINMVSTLEQWKRHPTLFRLKACGYKFFTIATTSVDFCMSKLLANDMRFLLSKLFRLSPWCLHIALLLCSFLLGQNTRQSMELPSGKSTTVYVILDGQLTPCRLFVYHVSPLCIMWVPCVSRESFVYYVSPLCIMWVHAPSISVVKMAIMNLNWRSIKSLQISNW